MALLADNQAIMYTRNLTIYVVFGIFLALALHERLKDGSPAMAQTAAAFGLICAGLVIASGMVANVGTGVVAELYGEDPDRAASVWLALDFVVRGLGGGNEILGGLWALLVSWAALRAGGLPNALNYFGAVIGATGILTAVPALAALEVLGAVFGLGLIAWFAWVGIFMPQSSPSAQAYNRKGRQLI